MISRSTYVFDELELDDKLLTMPFAVNTNWHVITGAPSCGKTTIINLLDDQGYATLQEGAREYLEQEQAKGRTIESLRKDQTALQHAIRDMHVENENSLQPETLTFLDRTMIDCLAFYRVFGLDPNEALPDCLRYRYASVFFLERLPMDLDGYRYEDDILADFVEGWHIRDYTSLGYSLIHVPVMPPEERLSFILDTLVGGGKL